MWLCLAKFFDTYGNMISTVALLATLCVIIWYACETRGLKKETVKQTKINQRPFITLSAETKYKNSGLGVALNIEIKSFRHNEYTVTFDKDKVPVLGSKDESISSLYPTFTDDAGREHTRPSIPFILEELKDNESVQVYEFEINYEDFEKNRYKTLVKLSKEGIEYLGTDEV